MFASPFAGESPDEFCARLVPTRVFDETIAWIYASYKENRALDDDARFVTDLTEEDSSCGQDLLCDEDEEMLDVSADLTTAAHALYEGKSRSGCFPTADDLAILFIRKRCLTGKWMLFIPPEYADGIWRAIVTALMAGKLGIAAKVSPAWTANLQPNRTHLICVYTKDFSNKNDVDRVLAALGELGVRPPRASIYYKCDGMTYLSNTIEEWKQRARSLNSHFNIRPSFYSAKPGAISSVCHFKLENQQQHSAVDAQYRAEEEQDNHKNRSSMIDLTLDD